MDYNTLSILFFIRKERKNKDDLAPVYLRITVDGKRAEVSIKRYVDPDKWNSSAGKVKGTKDEVKDLNQYFDLIRGKIYRYEKELRDNDKPVTAKALKNKYL